MQIIELLQHHFSQTIIAPDKIDNLLTIQCSPMAIEPLGDVVTSRDGFRQTGDSCSAESDTDISKL